MTNSPFGALALLVFCYIMIYFWQIYKDSACTTIELWFHLGGSLSLAMTSQVAHGTRVCMGGYDWFVCGK